MRSGAGLVTIAIPEGINSALIKIKPKEVMTLPLLQTRDGTLCNRSLKRIKEFVKRADIVIIGPGLGDGKATQALVRRLIKEINKPMVIDADGLNALAGHLNSLKLPLRSPYRTMVLTPHPGEMSRLTGVSVKNIQADRLTAAKRTAKSCNAVLVLKGHKTVVADRSGKAYVNNTGNPGMATAGSGDVLAGIIGAFLGQGLDGFEAAKYAVYIHGLAGDLAAGEKTQLSLVASDIIDHIPQAVKLSS